MESDVLFLETVLYGGHPTEAAEGPAVGLAVGGEDAFGKTLHAPLDPIGDIFEKARRNAPVKRDIARDGKHDATARIVVVDDDLETIDQSWDELLGGSAAVAEKRATPGKTVAEQLGIVRYEDRTIDGQQWKFALNQANEVVKSRRVDFR